MGLGGIISLGQAQPLGRNGILVGEGASSRGAWGLGLGIGLCLSKFSGGAGNFIRDVLGTRVKCGPGPASRQFTFWACQQMDNLQVSAFCMTLLYLLLRLRQVSCTHSREGPAAAAAREQRAGGWQERGTFSQNGVFQTMGSMKGRFCLGLCFTLLHRQLRCQRLIPAPFVLPRGPLMPWDPAFLIALASVAPLASSSTQSCSVLLCTLCIARW